MQDTLTLYYTKRLLGSSTTLEGLNFYSALEEGTAEESLMMLQLDFVDYPSVDMVEGLERSLLDAGVPLWPGNSRIVYAGAAKPTIYIAWVKGIAFTPIIIGILVVTVLPVLLGGIIWLVLPSGIKEIITLGGMMLVMMGITKLIPKEKKAEKEIRQ